MKVKTVSFTYERKFNLGDFNSAAIGCTVWADVDEGEAEQTVIEHCAGLAKETVRQQALPLFAKQTARVKEIFARLPVELQAQAVAAINGDSHADS